MSDTGLGRLVPADGVRLKLLDEEGILFDGRRRMVYFLNTAATLLWCRIEDGEGTARLAEADEAAARARAMIARWQGLGLLVEPGVQPPPPDEPKPPRPRPARRVAPPEGEAIRRHYRLLGTDIALSFAETALADLVHPTLAHLECAAASSPLLVAIDHRGGSFRLTQNGRLLDSCRAPSGLAPLVKLLLARLAVARFPHRVAVHAGALASNAGALLLPAAASSGKSVLTAALMDAGWDYLSDDSALLDGDFAVNGVPYALTIKEGAWDVVAALHPELLQLPVHDRPDRQRVRYLPPAPPRGGAGGRERQVRWIVSPRYDGAGPPARLTRLKRAEALRLLLANCGWAKPLDWEAIERTIEWLGGVESYRAVYSNLAAAVATIDALALGC